MIDAEMTPASGALWARLYREAIAPNSEKIARIFLDGDVALLFFEVGDGRAQMRRDAVEGARAMGWRGGRIEIGRMNKTRAARFGDDIARVSPADGAADWLRRRSGNRLFLCVHVGTLCIDFVRGKGFGLVNGTTDGEWMS